MNDIELITFGVFIAFFIAIIKAIIQILAERWSKKEWVGLTDEEIESTYMNTINFQENARALEVKLKEKNYDFPNKLQD